MTLELTSLTPDGEKSISDLTPQDIAVMDPRERVRLINTAQQYTAKGGLITVEQSANLSRCLIYTRKREIQDNSHATRAAKRAADIIPANADDI